jgi:outer membrane protein OmpA-like peptidoglycan-associated protein
MEMEQFFGETSKVQEDDSFISVFDILLGLLLLALILIFLFFSITYPLDSKAEKKHEIQETVVKPAVLLETTKGQITPPIKQAASISLREAIYQSLLDEFKNDLSHWFAEIDETNLTMRFQNSETFFEVGHSSLNKHYQLRLADFFPRYVKILKEYKDAIETLSIEGHTSSEWKESVSQDEAYFNNMALSQKRTHAVLEYCLQLPSIRADKEWLRHILTANGLSSSRLIMENNFENIESSRRVEFRIYVICER